MWWLQLVGVIAFAVVVGISFSAWRSQGAPSGSRAYMIGLLVVASVVLTVGAVLTAVTDPA